MPFIFLVTDTVMNLSVRTDRSGQGMLTQIRQLFLLEEQSDQGLHCLHFSVHLWDTKPICKFFVFQKIKELYEYGVFFVADWFISLKDTVLFSPCHHMGN